MFLTNKDSISQHAIDFIKSADQLVNSLNAKKQHGMTISFRGLDVKSKHYVVSYKDYLGNCLLNSAAGMANEDVAIDLVKLGFDVNSYNSDGNSVLINAVKNQLHNLIDVLLEKGVDVDYAKLEYGNSGKKIGNTALMFASRNGDLEIVKKLVEHGADINYCNQYNQYAILLTVEQIDKNFKCFQYLLEQPGISFGKHEKTPTDICRKIINYGTIEHISTFLEKGFFNPETYDDLCNEVNRNNINLFSEHSIPILNYISAFMNSKKLNEELTSKVNSSTKKMKI